MVAKLRTRSSPQAYRAIEQLENDMCLMSQNARTYNLEDSHVFRVCEELRGHFYKLLVNVQQRFGLRQSIFATPPPPGTSALYTQSQVAEGERELMRMG